MNEIEIQDALLKARVKFSERAEIARRIHERNPNYKGASIRESVYADVEDKAKFGRMLYKMYCEREGKAYTYKPENESAVVEQVAKRLGCTLAQLKRKDAALHDHVISVVASFLWLDAPVCYQEIDAAHVGNTIYKREILPGLDESRLAALKAPAPKPQAETRALCDTECRAALRAYLEAHRHEEFTYNQAMRGIGTTDYKQASGLLKELARTDASIYAWDVKVTEGERKGKIDIFYKFAPERAAIEREPARRKEIVKKAIVDFLEAHPRQSKRAIREAMKNLFGRLDHKTVDDCLKELVEDGKYVDKESGGGKGKADHYSVWY